MRGLFGYVFGMVKSIPIEIRRRVVELYLSGYNYREINAETRVSLGAISSIIDEARNDAPDIDDLRELNTELRQADASLIDALRGAVFIEKLNDLNVPVERIRSCIGFLDKYGEDAGSVLEWGLKLKDLERSQGMSYEQIVISANQTAEELHDQTQRYNKLRSREATLRKSMPEIERLKALKEKMSRYGQTTEHLDGFINFNLRLEELGFTPQTAELLASELEKIGLDTLTAANRLSNLLSQHRNLEDSLAEMTGRRDSLRRDIANMKDERGDAEDVLKVLREQVSKNQRLIEDLENYYLRKKNRLDEDYITKKKELWDFMARIIPKNRAREFNLAILDLAALICTVRKPKHDKCPLKEICDYNLSE